MYRQILRKVWYTRPKNYRKYPRAIGGFRTTMSSGDWLSRVNTAKDHSNKPPVASGNVKYVYDSSNYTRYLKERALNKQLMSTRNK